MNALKKSCLTAVIGLLSLSGCADTHVSDTCPSPTFLRCSTICEVERKQLSDEALNDLISVTGTMIKLQETSTEKEALGCKC